MSTNSNSFDFNGSNDGRGSATNFKLPGCSMCDKKDVSKSYCTSCKCYLCERCNFLHEIMLRYNSHRVLNLNSVQNVQHLEMILQNGEEESGAVLRNSFITVRRALQNHFLEGTKSVSTLLKMSDDLTKSTNLLGQRRSETLAHVDYLFKQFQKILRDQKDEIVNILDNEYNYIFDTFVSHRNRMDHAIDEMLVGLSDVSLIVEDDGIASGTEFSSLSEIPSAQLQFEFLDDNFPVPEIQLFNNNSVGQLTDEGSALNMNNDAYPLESFTTPFVASEPVHLDFHVNPDASLTITDPDVPRSKFAKTMQIHKTFGQKGNGSGMFNCPHGFCLGVDEEIVVADSSNHRIQIFDKTGTFKFQFGIAGRHDGYFWHPRKVAFLPTQCCYVICDRGFERSRMQIFTVAGKFVKKINIHYIDIVSGIAVTPNEDILVVNSVTPTLFMIGQNDSLRSIDCSGFMTEPSDIAVAGKNIYICDFKDHCIVVMDDDGNPLRKFGEGSTIMFPNGIDISPNGYIFIGDSHGNFFHIVVCTLDGAYVTEFRCPNIKVSRCCDLKINSDGRLITVDKNYHHVIMLEDLNIHHP